MLWLRRVLFRIISSRTLGSWHNLICWADLLEVAKPGSDRKVMDQMTQEFIRSPAQSFILFSFTGDWLRAINGQTIDSNNLDEILSMISGPRQQV